MTTAHRFEFVHFSSCRRDACMWSVALLAAISTSSLADFRLKPHREAGPGLNPSRGKKLAMFGQDLIRNEFLS